MIAVDKFGAPNFDSLGNGSFLAFLASHDEACEALGGKLIGTNLNPSHISSVKQKVISIVHQLEFDKRDDQVYKSHYIVIATVFTEIVAAATINFALSSVRLLIEGGSYSRAATINFFLSARTYAQ